MNLFSFIHSSPLFSLYFSCLFPVNVHFNLSHYLSSNKVCTILVILGNDRNCRLKCKFWLKGRNSKNICEQEIWTNLMRRWVYNRHDGVERYTSFVNSYYLFYGHSRVGCLVSIVGMCDLNKDVWMSKGIQKHIKSIQWDWEKSHWNMNNMYISLK